MPSQTTGGSLTELAPGEWSQGLPWILDDITRWILVLTSKHTNKNTPTNMILVKTKWLILLGPINNIHGGYKFLCLNTANVVARRNFTEKHIPQEVIQQVSVISAANHQPDALTFIDRNVNNTEPSIVHHESELAGVDVEGTHDPQHIFDQEQEQNQKHPLEQEQHHLEQ